MYDLIVTDSLTQYWKLSFISIIFSVLSIAFGTTQAVGKALSTADRVLLYLFSSTDFIFRVSSIAFFLKQDAFKAMQPILLPAIVVYEMIPWFISIPLHPRTTDHKVWILFYSFAGAISSSCVAGAHLVWPEFEHVRKNFQAYFTIRFCISAILVGITMLKEDSASFFGITFSTGIISFCISWRIRALMQKYGESICIDKNLLLDKVDT